MAISRFGVVNAERDSVLSYFPMFGRHIGCVLLHICIVFCMTAGNVHADTFRFKRIGIDDGLSQSMVTSVTRDKRGFIWMGTTDGLNRYDGYQFSVYRYISDTKGFLPSSFILNVYEDHEGMLWIGTYGGGLVRYDPVRGKSLHFKSDPDDSLSLCGNGVGPLCEDRDGNLWIGTADGLNRLDHATGRMARYVHDPSDPRSLSANMIWAIFIDASGEVWIGAEKGLNRFDRATGKFVRFIHDPGNKQSISGDDVRALCEDDSGYMWIGTTNGLNRFDRSRGVFTRYKHEMNNPHSLPDNIVFAVHQDRSGRFWVGTSEGLGLLDRNTGSFTVFRHNEFDLESLGDDQIRRIYEDSAGTLWFATANGVSIYDDRMSRFSLWRRNPSDTNSLSYNMAHSLVEDRNGILWIGTDRGGLNRFDRKKNQFTHFRSIHSDRGSLPSDWVNALMLDRTGRLWVGTGEGLCRMESDGRSFIRFPHDPSDPRSIASNWILDIYEDRSGTVWIGTGEGLDRIDPSGKFIHHRRNPADSNSLSGDVARVILEDREGFLWVGTDNGLSRLDRASGKWITFRMDSNNPSSLSHNRILSLLEDGAGTLWIGTAGGLNRFDRSKNAFSRFTAADGFPSETINSILDDDHGNLWLGTNKGITRFNPKTRSCRNFDISDGLQASEFRPGSCLKTHDGLMFFGGVNGFNGFSPEDLDLTIPPSPVVITSARKYDIPIALHQKTDKDEITLSYDERFISFEFAVLDYVCPQKNQYSYIMEGVDSKWIFSGSRRFANYTNLSPGRYVFRVKGANGDGVWNESGPALRIHIIPPFWMTWWFRISLLLIAVIAVYGAHHIRIRVISHRNKLLEREVNRRTGELKKMTERLGDERARLKMLLDGLPGIVFLQAPDGGIRFANRLFHETFGDPNSIKCLKNMEDRPSLCMDCAAMPVFLPSEDRGCEWDFPDGRTFEVYDYPFADSETDGLILRLALDITDRKRSEKEFLNREKIRAALATAGAATHELNQPLQIISGYCEILGEHMDPSDPNSQIIRKIETQVIRMSEISKRMNKVIRYETKEYFNGMPILDIYKSSE